MGRMQMRGSGKMNLLITDATIVTCDANPNVATIHDRMPVILRPDSIETWLSGSTETALKLLTPYSGPTELRPVGRFVSNVKNDGPECLEDFSAPVKPADDERQGRLL